MTKEGEGTEGGRYNQNAPPITVFYVVTTQPSQQHSPGTGKAEKGKKILLLNYLSKPNLPTRD